MDVLARICLRLLIIAAAAVVAGLAFDRLRIVVLPVLLATLISALLVPVALALRRRGMGRTPAALLATGGALAGFGLVLGLLVPPFLAQLDDVGASVAGGTNAVQAWLEDRSWGAQVDDLAARVETEVRDHSGQLVGGVVAGVTMAVEVIAALLLSIVLVFFFVRDGDRIWDWIAHRWSGDARPRVDAMGRRAWTSLGGYLRGVALVALAESLMTGAGLLILGIPLALPLAVLTFFGAFIPVLGALLVGTMAALVALFSDGPMTALFVVVLYTAVQQVESNVLHPVIVGRAVEIHPVALLLAVSTGAVLAGIVGALLAPPALAAVHAALSEPEEMGDDTHAEPPGNGNHHPHGKADGRRQQAAANVGA